MMNAVGGTSLHYWAQHWRLNPWDFKVVSETRRRYGASRIPKGSTVEDWPFGYDELEPYYDKIEYEVGVSGQAGNINGTDRSARQSVRRPAKARVPDAAAALDRVPRQDGGDGAEQLGWHPFPGPGSHQLPDLPEPLRLHVPRLLQHRRLPRRREELHRRHDDSARTGDRPPQGRHRAPWSRRIEVDYAGARQRRHLRVRQRRVLPAGEGRPAGELHVRERRGCCCCRSRRRFPTGCRTTTVRSDATTSAITRARRCPALFPFDLGAWYGLPAQGVAVDDWADDNFDHSSLDFIGGGNLWVMSDRRPITAAGDEHLRAGAGVGLAVEGVHQGERRSIAQLVHPEDHAALRGELPRSRSGGEGSARPSR